MAYQDAGDKLKNRYIKKAVEPKKLLDELITPLTLLSPPQDGGVLEVYPILFTQGVNEVQTTANKLDGSGLQDELNRIAR